MEKLLMCRICMVENVRMHEVSNKNLQEIYEKLTEISFITQDIRPMLACYFCYAKLEQCCQFKKKCLDAEELFAQMLNSHVPKPLINRSNPEFVGGFVKTPVENISISDGSRAETGVIEIELPAVAAVPAASERLYEFIEVKVEHQSDELEPEYPDNVYPDIEDVPAHHSRSDSEDDVPLLKIKTEVVQVKEEELQQEEAENKRRADDKEWTPVAEKPKYNIRRTKLEDSIIPEQKKTIQTTRNYTLKPATEFENALIINEPRVDSRINKAPIINSVNNKSTEHQTSSIKEKPFKCNMCHRRYTVKGHLTCHIRTHTGERPYECDICHRSFANKSHLKCHIRTHTGVVKPFKCDICQRSFSLKNNLRTHVLTHTGEKPYKCHICGRGFTQNIHLRSHIPIHTGDKPFRCDVCDRRFSLKHSLKRHIKIHNDECKSSYNLKPKAKK